MEMKIYKLLSVILGSAMSFAFSSCENASNSFPDYEGVFCLSISGAYYCIG